MLKHWLIAGATSLALAGAANAQSHRDSGGTILQGAAPIYLYVSAGPSQTGLPVTTNTTLTVPSGATLAQICVEGAGVRYRDDGTAATASSGLPASSGACFAYSGPLGSLSFAAQSGSPTLDVAYYKAN
jgi:hypothetical protein